MFSGLPAYVSLSSTVMCTCGWFRATYRTKFAPVKPHPPVTRILRGSNTPPHAMLFTIPAYRRMPTAGGSGPGADAILRPCELFVPLLSLEADVF